MRDLLAADLQRLRYRSLTRVLLVVAFALGVAAGVIEFVHTAKHPFDPASGFGGAIINAATPLVVAGLLLGASMLGADYTSRALTTLLTWEPRRARVVGSRSLACAGVAGGISLVALVFVALCMVPSALFHSTGVTPSVGQLVSAGGDALRCSLLVAASAAAGVSLAALTRSTAAAIGVLVVYLVLVEQAAVSLVPSIGRWMLIADALSWVNPGSTSQLGGKGGPAHGHTLIVDGLLLLGAVLALHAVATAVFNRVDIG